MKPTSRTDVESRDERGHVEVGIASITCRATGNRNGGTIVRERYSRIRASNAKRGSTATKRLLERRAVLPVPRVAKIPGARAPTIVDAVTGEPGDAATHPHVRVRCESPLSPLRAQGLRKQHHHQQRQRKTCHHQAPFCLAIARSRRVSFVVAPHRSA